MLNVTVCSRTYGRGSNPRGGRHVALRDGTRAVEIIDERLVVCPGRGAPVDGGPNPRYSALGALLGADPIAVGATDPERVLRAMLALRG